MRAMRDAGIEVLISMLEVPEIVELGLDDEEMEARRVGIRFINFPVPDHDTPTDEEQFDRLVTLLDRLMREGKHIGIHCRACIGRSSVLAASLLVRSGMRPEEVWAQIGKARGLPVPETSDQRQFVHSQVVRQKPWHLL